jgi:hypothetical protein
MAKWRSLLALVLLIAACAPALPSKTPDAGLAAQVKASQTANVEEQIVAPEPTETISPSRLLPSSELQSYCLPWLDETPSLSSSIRLENGIQEGDSAVDFSLNDVRGETHQLSDMLETKPVLLVLGGYT